MKESNQEKEILENAKIEARNILLNAEQEANEIIKELNQLNSSEKNREANILRKNLKEKIKDTIEKEEVEENLEKYENIELNTPVFVKTIKQEGITISRISKDGEVLVQIGNMKMQIPVQNLQIIKEKSKKEKEIKIHTQTSKTKMATTEINIIGLNVEEARMIVDKFLDDSHLAKIQTVHIIHGKGTGKLRKGIHEFLQKHPHVKSYRLGTFGEGEMGVTVVELK